MWPAQFSKFLKIGLLEDMLCLFDEQDRTFYTLVKLGADVCGDHPNTTHGGVLHNRTSFRKLAPQRSAA